MAARRLLILSGLPRRAEALKTLLAGVPRTEAVRAASAGELRGLLPGGASGVFLDTDDDSHAPLELCRELREARPWGAFALVLFGAGPRSERAVRSLDAGADDYWTYPFNEVVCQAYLRALLRRLSAQDPEERPIEAGGIRVEPASRRAYRGSRELSLRSKEFDLLLYLMKTSGRALGRDELLRGVWGYEESIPTRTVDYHVSQLRKRLGPSASYIETVAGVGYRFSP